MRTLVTIAAWLLLAVVLLGWTPAHAQIEIQDYMVGDPPQSRTRICIAEDGSCDELWFQVENHEQFVIVNATPGVNVQADVINLSDAPNDPRAVAAWNALAHGGAVMQAKVYGCNYPGTLSGIPLACLAEFIGYLGAIIGTHQGPLRVVVDDEHVATYQRCGFGFGAGCTGGKNLLSQGWGGAPPSVEPGTSSEWTDPASGHKFYWGHGLNGVQTFRCLTCAP